MKNPEISIIISTYNSPEWLDKVLKGYTTQTYKDFEIVIADDGSKQPTFDIIEHYKSTAFYEIQHIWHEDDGFQKSKILNSAITACKAAYILMSDGDCIPRKDFVFQHHTYREQGYFLSGGCFRLPMDISKSITHQDIVSQDCFDIKWLRKKGLRGSFKDNKITSSAWKAKFLNLITPTKASWNGHNASGWKEDIIAINGFDERMQYGGQDRELGERLINNGIKSKQIRYNAICIHLDHARGYKTKESIDFNKGIRRETHIQKKTWAVHGIKSSKEIISGT